jgi:hypothetical protein
MGNGTHVDNGIVGQRSKADIQCFVHLFGCALEELAASCELSCQPPSPRLSGVLCFPYLLRCIASTIQLEHDGSTNCVSSKHTTDEERIASEDGLIAAVLHEVADAVLRVTRSVHAFDGDAAQLEGLAMLRRLCDAITILAADDV